jgi:hypothetical protein
MVPSTSRKNRSPSRIDSGSATKNTCICGISRDSTPSPILNSSPKARNGVDADAKRAGGDLGDQRRDVADGGHFARLEQVVARVERGDDQVVHVGGEEQRDAEHGEEIADDHALLALGRIDGGDEAQAQLLGDHRACHFECGDGQPRREAKHGADHDLLDQQHDGRTQRAGVDVIGRAMQRQEHCGKDERDGELEPRRNVLLAETGQQHHHGSGAGKDQEEGRPDRRKEGDIEVHGSKPRSATDDACGEP